MRTMLKSTIHRATVTTTSDAADGGIKIDVDLMEAASLLQYEQVQVINLTRGTRLDTYVIEGPRGSGAVCLAGASPNEVAEGDALTILAYDQVAEPETRSWIPTLVYLGEGNQIERVAHDIPQA